MKWHEFMDMLDEAYKELNGVEKEKIYYAITLVHPIIERYRTHAPANDKYIPAWKLIGLFGYTLNDVINYLSAYFRIALFKVFPSMRRKMLPELLFRARCVFPSCREQGECVLCGCLVPDKLFQSGSCYCYPEWGWFTKSIYKGIVLKQFLDDPVEGEYYAEEYEEESYTPYSQGTESISGRDLGDEYDENSITHLP